MSVEGYAISFPDLHFPRLKTPNFRMYISAVPPYCAFPDQIAILVMNSVDMKMTVKKHTKIHLFWT